MFTDSIELVIDKNQNILPSASKQIDDVLWKFSIQKDNQLGMFLNIECCPVNPCKYWECDLSLKFEKYTVGSEIKILVQYNTMNLPKFSNFTTSAKVLQIDENVTSLVLQSDSCELTVFELTEESLFDEPMENITDCKLIVEGQTLLVCKRILATYSEYFYNLFYNSDERHQIKHVIPGRCNAFRVFLSCLYGQHNFIQAHHVKIKELATRFKAEQCLEEVETCLFSKGMSEEDILHFTMLLNNLPDVKKRKMELYNFKEKYRNLTDIVLLVGDEKFYVSKQLLAYHSSYFHTLFYSDIHKKGKEDIELKDIDADEFDMFLQNVYNENVFIAGNNAKSLLKLSQMYDTQSIVRKCINLLKIDKSMNEVEKIQVSVSCNAPELFDHVLSKLKFSDLPKLYDMDGFDELDDSTIAMMTRLLLDKEIKSGCFKTIDLLAQWNDTTL